MEPYHDRTFRNHHPFSGYFELDHFLCFSYTVLVRMVFLVSQHIHHSVLKALHRLYYIFHNCSLQFNSHFIQVLLKCHILKKLSQSSWLTSFSFNLLFKKNLIFCMLQQFTLTLNSNANKRIKNRILNKYLQVCCCCSLSHNNNMQKL